MAVNIRPHIIINGKSSLEVSGLMICSLPPITKPKMRVTAQEIDGKAGDVVTELGFSSPITFSTTTSNLIFIFGCFFNFS